MKKVTIDELRTVIKHLNEGISRKRIFIDGRRSMLAAIQGNTQLNFALHCNNAVMPIDYMTRGYTNAIKSAYDMVKLGLKKGLDYEIDTAKAELSELRLKLAEAYQEYSLLTRLQAQEDLK